MRAAAVCGVLLVGGAAASFSGPAGAAQFALSQLAELSRCADEEAGCADWAQRGECARNAPFMTARCAKSCQACGAKLRGGAERRSATEVALYALRSLCPDKELRRLCTVPVREALHRIEELATGLLREGSDPAAFVAALRRAEEVGAAALDAAGDAGAQGDEEAPPAERAAGSGPELRALPGGGALMPMLGFGTWQITGAACEAAVRAALKAGYRHIDTAEVYANEAEIGKAWKASGVPRSELFLATKLGVASYGDEARVRGVFEKQLAALQTDYVDLYMLHGVSGDANAQMRSWRALEALHKEGRARAIGVSNFEWHDLDALLRQAKVPPAVVQNKFSPYHWGSQWRPDSTRDVVSLARENNVSVVGYSIFNKWPFALDPVRDPEVRAVAQAAGRTPQQVLLRWALQVGAAVIPRSSAPDHVADNFRALDFVLAPSAVRAISALHDRVETPWNLRPNTAHNNVYFFPPDTLDPARLRGAVRHQPPGGQPPDPTVPVAAIILVLVCLLIARRRSRRPPRP